MKMLEEMRQADAEEQERVMLFVQDVQVHGERILRNTLELYLHMFRRAKEKEDVAAGWVAYSKIQKLLRGLHDLGVHDIDDGLIDIGVTWLGCDIPIENFDVWAAAVQEIIDIDKLDLDEC